MQPSGATPGEDQDACTGTHAHRHRQKWKDMIDSYGLDDALYGMLWALYRDRQYGTDRSSMTVPTEIFLRSLQLLCLAQRRADADYAVPWNRHFITCLQQLTKAHLLVGPNAIT